MTRAEQPLQLHLYGRADCHLCDELAMKLEGMQAEFDFEVHKFDVDAAPANRARYGRRIPVLTDAADREWCAGRCDEEALRARLALECPAR